MSIPNLSGKIKGLDSIDKVTILYSFIIILVGLASFGLGRLSVGDLQSANSEVSIIDGGIATSINSASVVPIVTNDKVVPVNSSINKYVASKNGKLYYTASCAGAKRIKPENQIWFKDASDAQKQGLTLSKSCK